MIYSEAAYFDGFHVAHIAAWEDFQTRQRRHRARQTAMRGRRLRSNLEA